MDFSNLDKMVYGKGNLEEDDDLMAELMALQQEEEIQQRRAAPPQPRPGPSAGAKPAVPGIDPALLAAALADTPDDMDVEPDDDLLAELDGLVGDERSTESAPAPTESSGAARLAPPPPARTASAPTVTSDEVHRLRELLKVYEKMKVASEKENNAAKTRRLQRTTDKIKELVKKAERGVKIDPGEIPPAPPGWTPSAAPAITRVAPPPPSIPSSTAPPLPPRKESAPVQSVVASSPKKSRTPSPVPVTPPTALSSEAAPSSKRAQVRQILSRRQLAFVNNAKAAHAAGDKEACMANGEMAKTFEEAIKGLDAASDEDLEGMDMSEVPKTPPPYRKKEAQAAPKTFVEGLEQRMLRYLATAKVAKEAGNERKSRMNQRLASQYQEAIQLARAGKPVNVADLPSLPDMPPLPPQGGTPGRSTQTQVPQGPAPGMRPPPDVGPLAPSGQAGVSRNASQLQFLQERQLQFKKAAMIAKGQGDMEMAKKYLIQATGFDKMIEASRAGRPVSIKDTPIPPQVATPVSALQPRIVPSITSNTGVEGRGEALALLEKGLIEQVQLAENNRMRFTRLGDVGKVKTFENWATISKKDLLFVRAVAKQGLPVPKFHFEQRIIPTADLFPELAEDALEINLIHCKDVPLPSGYEPHHANIFLKYTFPYPSETPQSGKSKLVSGLTSPQFDEVVLLQIGSRKQRGQRLMRILKRSPLKIEVFQKGSFLRSDKLLGTCEIKLDVLENKAEIEESLPLKDGRKAVGGLLSLRIRVREPLGDAKAQATTHKWIVLDN